MPISLYTLPLFLYQRGGDVLWGKRNLQFGRAGIGNLKQDRFKFLKTQVIQAQFVDLCFQRRSLNGASERQRERERERERETKSKQDTYYTVTISKEEEDKTLG